MDGSANSRLDARYSDPTAELMPLDDASHMVARAPLYWLSTVRPDGRPHVTPMIGVWHAGGMCFCTGPEERKNRNLAGNPECVVTTGTNSLDEGADIVIEGPASPVTTDQDLRMLADAYVAKYGEEWRFDVRDGAFHHQADGGEALVYRVEPRTIFAFAKSPYGQTRWRFDG